MTDKFKTKRRLFQGSKGLKRKRKAFRRCLLMLALACSKSAGAQSGSTSSSSGSRSDELRLSRGTLEQELKPKPKALEAFLRFESVQYPTVIPGKENLSQNNMIEAGLGGDVRAGIGRFIYDAEAGRSLNINYSYFAVQDFAYQAGRGPFSVTLGRHRDFWSEADRNWNLGLWQPLFSQDSLRLKPQGLTGLHLAARFPKIQALMFYSPFTIPSITPDLAARDGEITSESRWFSSVPKTTELIGKDTELYYRLNIPELRELLAQENIAGRIRVGDEERGPWASVSMADKAQNTMYFKYDASLRAGETGSLGEIELRPVLLRHQIAAVDMGYQYEGGNVSLAYTEDRPVGWNVLNEANSASGRDTDFIQQRSEPVRIVSAHWEQELRAPRMKMPIAARVDYMKAQTAPTMDVDASGVVRSSLFPDRLLFTNAISVEARHSISSRSGLRVKYLRDFDQQGSLWSAELQYQTRAKWVVHLGADILGSDDPSEANTDTRFLNAYRSNDRVYGGLSYVF